MATRRGILLHTCCAVCLEAVFPAIEALGFSARPFFYNPNIHPFREFEKRLRAVEVACDVHKVSLIADREYGLATYLERIAPAGDIRCLECYALRMDRAAREAVSAGIEAFTTTLLVSGHQKHDDVARAGREAAEKHGIEFFYRDWRELMSSGIEAARKRSLYRQQYCGCIWSEYERFGPKKDEGRG